MRETFHMRRCKTANFEVVFKEQSCRPCHPSAMQSIGLGIMGGPDADREPAGQHGGAGGRAAAVIDIFC